MCICGIITLFSRPILARYGLAAPRARDAFRAVWCFDITKGKLKMSKLAKTMMALGLAAAFAGSAYAQQSSGGGEPWVLRANMGYTVDAKGNTMITNLPQMNPKMMKKVRAVPRGTVFFMQDGKLMMADWPTGQ